MDNKIMNGFPLRRCSWLYAPVAPASLIRVMIRWLDSVCTLRVAQNHGRGGTRVTLETKGTIHGT